ncbi:hypothetical protein HHK36_017247 [Tetracentron sinense]|uniref:Uncharacterized protein n=1 Tax=Tetracentron sinense TaxID=13715 RepID=A0A834Z2G1_TETSI|nr:hypothetical protein HHK36_017247 [Tetracentron sinense]
MVGVLPLAPRFEGQLCICLGGHHYNVVQGVLNGSPTKKPSSFQGEPTIFFSMDKVEHSAAPFKTALIAKCSFGRPAISDLKIHLKKVLHAKLAFSIEIRDHNHISLLNLFNSNDLVAIGSIIGKVLRIDGPTRSLSRPSLARVCIKVDLRKVVRGKKNHSAKDISKIIKEKEDSEEEVLELHVGEKNIVGYGLENSELQEKEISPPLNCNGNSGHSDKTIEEGEIVQNEELECGSENDKYLMVEDKIMEVWVGEKVAHSIDNLEDLLNATLHDKLRHDSQTLEEPLISSRMRIISTSTTSESKHELSFGVQSLSQLSIEETLHKLSPQSNPKDCDSRKVFLKRMADDMWDADIHYDGYFINGDNFRRYVGGQVILEYNPGSIARFKVMDDHAFHRLFISFHASIRGFQRCRIIDDDKIKVHGYRGATYRHFAQGVKLKNILSNFKLDQGKLKDNY